MLFSSNESISSPRRASENPQHSRRARKFLPRLFSHQKCVHTAHKREREKKQAQKTRKKFPTQNDQRPPERDVIQSTALTSTSSKDHLPKSFTSCVASSAIFVVVCCYAFKMFLRVTLWGKWVVSRPFLQLFCVCSLLCSKIFFFRVELFFLFFSSSLFSVSSLAGKNVLQLRRVFFLQTLQRKYTVHAHTHAHTSTRFTRERRRRERERETRQTERERERESAKRARERRIAFFKKEEE